MKRFSQQFHTASKRVSLTKAESRELKERLVSYMEYHPLPESMRMATSNDAVTSEPFWFVQFNTFRTRVFSGMAVLGALIIVPFAAEQALPGDVLYPVKVQFNEEIRSSLAMTPYQQIEWETRRVERRLAEARLLATEGKLTQEIEAAVVAAVRSHGDAAQASLAKLRETDRDEAAIAELSFASALEVESEVLENDAERREAAGATTTGTIAAAIADIRAGVATPETSDVSFERLLARVEDETTHATELLLSVRDGVTNEERADIDRRLADINRKIVAAHTANATSTEMVTTLATSSMASLASAATSSATSSIEVAAAPSGSQRDEAAAKQYLRDALRDTQKLIRFMTDIDVKTNVSVDELVPVTPTEEEREASIARQQNALTEAISTITSRAVEDEKIAYGLSEVAALRTKVEAAVTLGEYDTAEQALANAAALVDDMLKTTASTSSESLTEPASPQAATSSSAVETTTGSSTTATSSAPTATSSNTTTPQS